MTVVARGTVLTALVVVGLVCNLVQSAAFNQRDLKVTAGDKNGGICKINPTAEPQSDKKVLNFSSDAGETLLKRVLTTKYSEAFMKIVPNYQTQQAKTFCGLATLATAITTLKVDPDYYPKPFLFQQKQLACCPTIDTILEEGITFSDFVCIASLNGLNPVAVHGNGTDEGLAEFRRTVLEVTSSTDRVIGVDFNRRLLGFNKTGHFSTLGAYDCDTDRVLIMDVQRWLFDPMWVSLSALYDGISDEDPKTKESRGYAVLTRETHRRPTLLNQLLATFRGRVGSRVVKETVGNAVRQWRQWLKEPVGTADKSTLLNSAAEHFASAMSSLHFCCVGRDFCATAQKTAAETTGEATMATGKMVAGTTATGTTADTCGRVDANQTTTFCSALLNTEAYKMIRKQSKRTEAEDQLLASLFLAWPYTTGQQVSDREQSVGRSLQSETNGLFWEMIKETRDQLAGFVQHYQ